MYVRLTGISQGATTYGVEYDLLIVGPFAVAGKVLSAQGKQFHVKESIAEIEAQLSEWVDEPDDDTKTGW